MKWFLLILIAGCNTQQQNHVIPKTKRHLDPVWDMYNDLTPEDQETFILLNPRFFTV